MTLSEVFGHAPFITHVALAELQAWAAQYPTEVVFKSTVYQNSVEGRADWRTDRYEFVIKSHDTAKSQYFTVSVWDSVRVDAAPGIHALTRYDTLSAALDKLLDFYKDL